MNKNQVILDIENKIKSLNSYEEEEVSALKEYYSLILVEGENNRTTEKFKEIKSKVDEIYKNKMKREKIKASSFLDLSKIRVIISTVGLIKVSNDILDELPFEKTLRVCENIEKVYLFHTEEARKNYQQIKEKISKQKENVKVNEKFEARAIVREDVTSIRNFLYEVIKDLRNQGIEENEILIDLTAGFKLASVSMYRIAVENGIKVINWKEIYFSKYKKGGETDTYENSENSHRIVFSTTLEIIKEVSEENREILSDINKALDRKEYKTVSNFYRKRNRQDEKYFFDELSELFNQDAFLAFDLANFTEKLKTFVDNIMSYKNFSEAFKDKIKTLILYLKIVSDFNIEKGGASGEFLEELDDKYEIYKNKNKDDQDSDFSDFFCKYYIEKLRDLKLNRKDMEVFIESFIKDLDEEILDNETMPDGISKEKLYMYLTQINVLEKLKDTKEMLNYLGQLDKDTINKITETRNVEENYIERIFQGDEELYKSVKEILKLDYLKEKVDDSIVYDNGILEIKKFEIKIDFEEDFKKEELQCFERFGKNVLEEMLGNKKYLLTEKQVENIYTKDDNENSNTKKSSIGVRKSNFKRFLETLNKKITQKIKETNYHYEMKDEKFILGKVGNYLYKVNEIFY